jgi:hypothetical protein
LEAAAQVNRAALETTNTIAEVLRLGGRHDALFATAQHDLRLRMQTRAANIGQAINMPMPQNIGPDGGLGVMLLHDWQRTNPPHQGEGQQAYMMRSYLEGMRLFLAWLNRHRQNVEAQMMLLRQLHGIEPQ